MSTSVVNTISQTESCDNTTVGFDEKVQEKVLANVMKDPQGFIDFMKVQVETTMSDDPNKDHFFVMMDLLEEQLKSCGDDQDKIKENMGTVLKVLGEIGNKPETVKRTDEEETEQATLAFNKLLVASSNMPVSSDESFNDDIKIMTKFPFINYVDIVDIVDVEKVNYEAFCRFLDFLFRGDKCGKRLSDEEVLENPRKIPDYFWNTMSDLSRPRVYLEFREEPLIKEMYPNVSSLMRLYEKSKEHRDFSLPENLHDHINEWLLSNVSPTKSATKH